MAEPLHTLTVADPGQNPKRYTVYDTIIFEETWVPIEGTDPQAWTRSVREFVIIPY